MQRGELTDSSFLPLNILNMSALDGLLHRDVLEHHEELWSALEAEITWEEVHHKGGLVPRLLSIQGEYSRSGPEPHEQVLPVYRHPMDDEPMLMPFSPTVRRIKEAIEGRLGLSPEQAFNHVLIQKYRDGADFISEHADKTLDIAPDSVIANYSLGSERVLTLRSKERRAEGDYEIINVLLPNNSVFCLDLAMNKRMRHSIHRQKQQSGARISLTFRRVATFYHRATGQLTGQGAPKEVYHYVDPEAEYARMLQAFRAENAQADFVWEEWYGKGFSVLPAMLRPI